MRVDWKSITMKFGEQSAMICLTTWMLALFAIALDSGRYYFGMLGIKIHMMMQHKTLQEVKCA